MAELSQELRRSQWRVLHAARVQAALLQRAQRKLTVMANMLAGCERNYPSPMELRHGLPLALTAESWS